MVPHGSSPLFIANYEIHVWVFHIKPLGLQTFVFRIRRPLTTTPLLNTEICSEISIFLSIYSSSGSRTIKKQTFLLAVWEGLLIHLFLFWKPFYIFNYSLCEGRPKLLIVLQMQQNSGFVQWDNDIFVCFSVPFSVIANAHISVFPVPNTRFMFSQRYIQWP